MERSDDELMAGYRGGDAAAFDALFQRHHAGVFHFARAMLHEAGAAEEILQETFLAVARAARTYEARGQFRTWLMRIVRNRCLNRLESMRIRQSLAAEGAVEEIDPPSPIPSPVARAEAMEQWGIVQEALGRLPLRQREAVLLFAFEHLSYREISQVLDMPVNTVKTLIHRARATLAGVLEERG